MTVKTETAHNFTVDWFSPCIPVWSKLPFLSLPFKFLEIGSFEGRSACWLLENLVPECGILYCIDTWEGSPEFASFPAGVTETSYTRFRNNTSLSRKPGQILRTFRNKSVHALSQLLISAEHLNSFDFIYIDGSHIAPDVITDACMAWPLLKPGGLLVFDDYLWNLQHSLLSRPKLAIDMFTTLFNDQIETVGCGGQYIVRKKQKVVL